MTDWLEDDRNEHKVNTITTCTCNESPYCIFCHSDGLERWLRDHPEHPITKLGTYIKDDEGIWRYNEF